MFVARGRTGIHPEFMPIVIPPAAFILSRHEVVVLAKLTGISRLPVIPYIEMPLYFSHDIHVLGGQFHSRNVNSINGWIRLLHLTAALTTLFAP